MFESGIRAAELLEHPGGMVIECSLSPVALIRKVEVEAAIFEQYSHALPICTKHQSMDVRTEGLAQV